MKQSVLCCLKWSFFALALFFVFLFYSSPVAPVFAGWFDHSSKAPADCEFEAAFSPFGNSLELVVSTINSAKKTILVAAYSFTSKPISTALLAASKRGVKVQVVADEKSNAEKYGAVQFLANQGVPVRLNGNYAIHHNKFMVVDGVTVETGSFNYTAAAAGKNAENVLVVRNNPALAEQYTKEWERLWREAGDVKAAY